MNFTKWLLAIVVVVALVYLFRYIYFKPNYGTGEEAPEFTVELMAGDSFSLSDLRGHYVLLDFWGSWCGPCRAENPKIVRLYSKYEDSAFENAEGFEVVSIAMETNRQRWLNAINKDNLYWKYHHADFNRMDSDLAKLYGVRQIPTKFFIGPEGRILGVNQSVAEIDTYLGKRSTQ